MNTHAGKHSGNKSQSIAHAGIQKNQNSSSSFQFADKRPEALAQKNLQDMANQSPRAMQLKALQKMADNSPLVNQTAQLNSFAGAAPVQLFKGAARTNQAGAVLDFTFNQVFTDKHIADDEAGAIANTRARLADATDKAGPKILAGTIGNTVETEAGWKAAIDANTDIVPENFVGPTAADKAAADYDAADYNIDDGRLTDSSYMQINAWEVTYSGGALSAEVKDVNRRVGGSYEVNDLDVTVDIDHATQ